MLKSLHRGAGEGDARSRCKKKSSKDESPRIRTHKRFGNNETECKRNAEVPRS
jgi:hypothetical protein